MCVSDEPQSIKQYAGREGAAFEPRVDRVVGEFIDLIERKYISTPSDFRPIDFGHKAQYFALDVISELGWGEAIGFLKNDTDMFRYVEINEAIFLGISTMLITPWMFKFLQIWPLSLAMPKEGDKVGFGMLIRLEISQRTSLMRLLTYTLV